MRKRLAIITTHPIQYYAPIFKLLFEQGKSELELMIFYSWGTSVLEKFDPGFGRNINWDIPLLTGYPFTFLTNAAKKPGTHHFWGINNPNGAKEIEKWEPTHLLIFGWSWAGHLSILRYFHGKIPVYFRGDSHLLDPSTPLKRVLRKTLLTFIYRYTDKIFAVGINNKNYFLAAGVHPEKIIILPHAIDNQRFGVLSESQKEELLDLKLKLGLSSGHFVFLFSGKFQAKKGISDLVHAFRMIENPLARLILTGSGELEEYLQNEAKIDTRILILPFQNQTRMPLIYRLADWFVYPSHGPGETWGLAVNEAMACGVPCIVSDRVGCAADLIIEGKTGYRFQSGNLVELLNLLRKVLDEKNNNAILGNNARQHIQSFSFERVVFGLMEAVKS